MSKEIYHTSVNLEFGNDSSGSLLWEEDDDRVYPSEGYVFLRLYPKAPEVLVSTSGSASAKGASLKPVVSVLSFLGNKEQSLQYPSVSGIVSIEQLGSAYDIRGVSQPVSFSYNVKKNTIVASKVCFAVVKIKYDAPYVSYLYKYAGTPCTTQIVKGELEVAGGYSEATILAVNYSEGVSSTIKVTPDACKPDKGGSGRSGESDNYVPRLVLEVHKDFPARIIGSGGSGVKLGCKVRQIPDVPATLEMSSGSSSPERFTGSMDKATKDSKLHHTNNYMQTNTEEVKELVAFQMNGVTQLKYQPSGGIVATPTGPFLDQWGNTVSPHFGRPGDVVTTVEWLNEHTYINPVRRVLGADELAVTTASGKVITVYGSVKLDYSIKFNFYDVTFDTINANRPEDGWFNIHMRAVFGDQIGYLQLESPSMKEK